MRPSTDPLGYFCAAAKRAGRLSRTEVIELARQVQAWRRHPDGTDACPGPIRQRGIRARNRLVECNLMLVTKLAHKYLRRIAGSGGIDLADLLQAGALGLNRAAELFDPEKGYEFSTYAYNWIRQGMGSEVENRAETIRIPAVVRYAMADGQPRKNASVEQIAAAAAAQSVRSLDYRYRQPGAEDGDITLAAALADPRLDPLELLEDAERQERIEAAAGEELALLRLRFEDKATYADLAPLMGIRAAEMKQAINAAAHRLRQVVAAA